MRKPERKFYSFHAKILLKHNFWGVVVFPSIFWVQKFCQNTIFGSSRISFHFFDFKNSVKTQLLGVVEFPFIFLISKIQCSGFSFQYLKNYHNLTIFQSDFEFIFEVITFLSKIQNHTSEKTGKKILLLYGKISRYFLIIKKSLFSQFIKR